MKKKLIRRNCNLSHNLPDDMHPIVKQVYVARGVTSATEIERELSHLLPYQDLLGIEDAMHCIGQAVIQQQRILIVGDFDADGATSTTVAVRALRMLGAQHVNFLVPNRFEYGYGLTPEIVNVAAEWQPGLIITVDNGIASCEGVAAAKEKGIQVVITDHHLPGQKLPKADAIVNPNQSGCSFASKNLAGVGVIFYVMIALRSYLRGQNWFSQQQIEEPNLAHLLDLVALGTVADVVPLDKNNRVLVYQGLKRIQSGRCSLGIKAILEISGRVLSRVSASDLGFAIGPRLNAAGRLDDMTIGINCLLTDQKTQALEYAKVLNELNHERRFIEQTMQQQALTVLEKYQRNLRELPLGICLYDPEWHQGVSGILAGRLKEQYYRPTIIFAPGNVGEIKGSARSIPGLHIRDALERVATQYPQLIEKFGGHAMAAGLTLKTANFSKFNAVWQGVLTEFLSEEHLRHEILSDGDLATEYLNLNTAQALSAAGPWGQQFPEPLFDGQFEILQQRLVGDRHLKLVLNIPNKTQAIEAILFNVDLNSWPNQRVEKIHAAYRLDINEFRDRQTLQLILEYVEVV